MEQIQQLVEHMGHVAQNLPDADPPVQMGTFDIRITTDYENLEDAIGGFVHSYEWSETVGAYKQNIQDGEMIAVSAQRIYIEGIELPNEMTFAERVEEFHIRPTDGLVLVVDGEPASGSGHP